MSDVKVLPAGSLGRGFVPPQYLPPGEDEYSLRNRQSGKPADYWRALKQKEIETLLRLGNEADDWDTVLVADPFQPQRVRNCFFHGLVRIGRLEDAVLEHHDLRTPAGLTESRLISCDIGDHCAIHHVRYLAHTLVGDRSILLNVDEMHVTNHAKFGNGILKDGEKEDVRVWMDLVNETGARAVLPFDGMTPADAWLWAKYRDDAELLARLKAITQARFDSRRGYYGTVGQECVIKNTGVIKDVQIGPCCYIKGANKLKNLTIHSSAAEPTQIGEGVELVNGIVGPGCRIFYGSKAVRFIMGPNSSLKYGARLIHSLLGDNSTVSCCELLNNLIFPSHEQHHNNSFLTASLVLGQSNIAAGATIGSNHNSRANDGEILAGRGFWPGLCVTLKHFSRFASYVLLAKADYPAELDVPLPFSLVANDASADRLLVMPAYWWMYNMYALARNTWKFQARDKRKDPVQRIEYDCLAPDTAEEIVHAMELLEVWTAKARLRAAGMSAETHACEREAAGDPSGEEDAHDLRSFGRALLEGPEEDMKGLEVIGEKIEGSKRPAAILKARAGYHAYRQMLRHYAMKNMLAYMQANPSATRESMVKALAAPRVREWANLGGQIVPLADVDALRADIRSGRLSNWNDVHGRYDELWAAYPLAKQRHALAVLLEVSGAGELTADLWDKALTQAASDQQFVRDQVFLSRKKDYDDPFRQLTFRNADEMRAVVGTPEDNSFVQQVRRETEEFEALVEAVRKRG